MTRRSQKPGVSPHGMAEEAERRARLGAALRANLARRKAQKRGRDEAASEAGPGKDEATPAGALESRPKVK